MRKVDGGTLVISVLAESEFSASSYFVSVDRIPI